MVEKVAEIHLVQTHDLLRPEEVEEHLKLVVNQTTEQTMEVVVD